MGNSCRGSFGSKYHRRSSAEPTKPPPSKCHHQSERSSVPDDSPKKPPKQQREAAAAVIMRRGFDPNSNYVLGHKTPNIRDLYILGRKLGQGQFGTTYLCTEIATGNDYACKSIAKRKLISKEDVEDVRREIQIMHHLSGHKNVVTIKGAYEDALYVHIVMELCSGGELFDRIIERGHFSERKAAELIRIIVGVVEACHSLGVMHRDLKPENFLLVNKDDDSSLKAIDFGLSVFFKPGLSEEEIAGLREMFQAMDTDNSGSITFDELKAGLRRYGSTLKDTEIRDLMEARRSDGVKGVRSEVQAMIGIVYSCVRLGSAEDLHKRPCRGVVLEEAPPTFKSVPRGVRLRGVSRFLSTISVSDDIVFAVPYPCHCPTRLYIDYCCARSIATVPDQLKSWCVA
ncbi:hypothetical protein GW17_00052698 [Ensete ventricosum]|nr:hypothetical protein GW17_00052698 [Ensete ventricosum]RZS09806.1 hypothetical protein BHM03_00040925 [Ensete ventricosum]